MAKRCPRCGLPKFDWRNAGETPSPTCSAMEEHADRAMLACRDREIALLKARIKELEAKIEAGGAWEAELAMRGVSDG